MRRFEIHQWQMGLSRRYYEQLIIDTITTVSRQIVGAAPSHSLICGVIQRDDSKSVNGRCVHHAIIDMTHNFLIDTITIVSRQVVGISCAARHTHRVWDLWRDPRAIPLDDSKYFSGKSVRHDMNHNSSIPGKRVEFILVDRVMTNRSSNVMKWSANFMAV
jgi:hypothetical protein